MRPSKSGFPHLQRCRDTQIYAELKQTILVILALYMLILPFLLSAVCRFLI